MPIFFVFGFVSSLPVEVDQTQQDLSLDEVPESTTVVADEIDQPPASPPSESDDLSNAETALGFIGIGIPVYGGWGYGGGYYRRPYYGGGWGGGWGGHHHHHHHGHWGHGHGHGYGHGHGHWG